MSTSPFRKGSQTAVESRPVVVDAGGDVVVEVGRVIDARGPQAGPGSVDFITSPGNSPSGRRSGSSKPS